MAKGKVIAGISGCTNPSTSGGCFIVAVDANTGKELWRTHKIAQPGSPGDQSWNGLPVENRNGGSSWTAGSYDPSLNLVYFGTGGPNPHAAIVRGTGDGAVLFSDSTLALDVDTGKIVWYRQFLPNDNWNLDHTFEQVLVDIEASLAFSGRSIGAPANSYGRARRSTRMCSRASTRKPERLPSTRA